LGADGKFGLSESRGSPSSADGVASGGINYSLGGAVQPVGGSYTQRLIGSSPGSRTISLGPAVGYAGYANINVSGSVNLPPLWSARCGV
jgi:hypothetical protein